MTKHYLKSGLFKALEGGAAYYGGGQRASVGPRGGRIKKISPTTGKPIYFKKWSSGQGYNPHPVSHADKGGYEVYKKGSLIGRTSGELPIHSDSDVSNKYRNNTKNYQWRDHADAHQAHFALAQYIKNLIAKRLAEGGDTSKLHGRYGAHMDFSKHHYKEALQQFIHGEDTPVSKEDLGKRQSKSGKFGKHTSFKGE